ncbi:MAG: porin [Bacteroidaceae bacterium]
MIQKLITTTFFCLCFINLMANEGVRNENEEPITVKLTTSTVTNKELKAQRIVDGEQPVQPLNLIIGPRKLTLWGYAQIGYTVTNKNHENKNSLEMTRIMLMANAEITQKLSFFMMYDAAKSELHEYYGQYNFSSALKLRIGQYKQPFCLENIMSPAVLNNIGYDASVLYMAGIATDPCHGNHVARDLGIMLTGDFLKVKNRNLLNYSLGVFNGPGMNQKDNNNQKDVIGMLNVLPLQNVMLSTSFLLGTGHAQANSPYGAFVTGENYKRRRWACGIEAKTKPLYLRSEYMIGNDGGIHSQGFYADAELHVRKNLDIVADYDYLKKNNKLAQSEQHAYMIGVQYWIYKRCRILSQFVYKDPKDDRSTRMWLTQFQIGF